MNSHNYQSRQCNDQIGANSLTRPRATSNYASTRKPNSAARAEIHSKEREKERTNGEGRKRANECVTRKNLWKIIEFSIAQKRESGRVSEREGHIPLLI